LLGVQEAVNRRADGTRIQSAQRKNRNVESELGSKAMHRDIVTANEIVDLISSL